jgi:hypothetical protein
MTGFALYHPLALFVSVPVQPLVISLEPKGDIHDVERVCLCACVRVRVRVRVRERV